VVVNNNGALGIEVEKAAEVEEAVRAALAHPGPALVDVMVNPDEPPMPGKVSYDQSVVDADAVGGAASPTRRPSPRPCSGTSSTSSGG
jgi:ribosomal protein S5